MQAKGLMRAVFGAAGAAAVLLSGLVQAAGVPGQGTWETTLKGRDISGAAVAASSASAVFLYDTTLDITWLRDANVNGRMSWGAANTWANGLTVGAWSDWRLPTVSPVNGKAFQWVAPSNNGSTDRGWAKTGTGWGVASEMGHLFYVTLGNKGHCTPNDASPGSCVPQPGSGLTNTATFQNMQSYIYWTGVYFMHVESKSNHWIFTPSDGSQGWYYDAVALNALAVRSGDVLVVPEPETWALMLAGLTALALARRRQRS